MIKRRTPQRDAIQQVIREEDRALNADEILCTARQVINSLNQSTVYRNLKLLVEKGWLRKINHPARGPLYERTDKDHHHHFHCRSCNKVYELPGCALNENESTPEGFMTEKHEIFLFGVCATCRTADGEDDYIVPSP
jgi:Fur family ferric uptake transcriptional regulator